MINKIKILSLGFILVACGAKKEVKIDPAITLYVDEFISVSKYLKRPVTLNDIEIGFGVTKTEDEPQRVGYCQWWEDDSHKVVVLDKESWFEYDDEFRLALLFHELGHCVLLRDHEERDNVESFMEPYILNGRITREHWPTLTQELFGSDILGPEYTFGGSNDSLNLNSFSVESTEPYTL
jgi:hypothetical protein